MEIIIFFVFLVIALPVYNIFCFCYGLVKNKVESKHLALYLCGSIILPFIISRIGPTTEFGRGVLMGITEFTAAAAFFLVNLIYAVHLSVCCWGKSAPVDSSSSIIDN